MFKKKLGWVLQSLVDMDLLNPASTTSLIVALDIVFLSLSFPNYKLEGGDTAHPADCLQDEITFII